MEIFMMDTKLNMEKDIIEKITYNHTKNEHITPLVISLSGIIQYTSDTYTKESYKEFIINKYS